MPEPYHFHIARAPQPRLALTIVHGLGEHGARYRYATDWFSSRGVDVLAGDLPGHGRSPGARGHIDRFDEYERAAAAFLRAAREQFSADVPHILFGHSMGGLIAALTAARLTNARDPAAPDGVVLSSPAFALCLSLPSFKVWAARAVSLFLPRLTQPSGILPNLVTRNPEVQAADAADPLLLNSVSLRWFFEFRRGMRQSPASAAAIRVPLAVFAAGSDLIVDTSATRRWFASVPGEQKEYREYPGLLHEILNEPERDTVLADIMDWLDRTFPR